MHSAKKTPKLDLTEAERACLRKYKIRLHELASIATADVSELLSISLQRAQTLQAMVEFQQIPSIGPKFANDLMLLGYYRLEQVKGCDGAMLFNELEQKIGVSIDPCVEDQFRLVVHYAEHPDSSKQWWDFTEERKQYRAKFGYPPNRPQQA